MKELIDTIRQQFRADQLVLDLVGLDDANEVKVYEAAAKTNASPPYVVWQLTPGGGIERTYGDDEALHQFSILVTVWANNPKLAWQISDAMDSTVKHADLSVPPWELAAAVRNGPPGYGPDRDTNLYGVAVPYLLTWSSTR